MLTFSRIKPLCLQCHPDSPHNLSEVINGQSGKNFFDFINGYRADEVARMLRDPDNIQLELTAPYPA